jgi:hypothetical protein
VQTQVCHKEELNALAEMDNQRVTKKKEPKEEAS